MTRFITEIIVLYILNLIDCVATIVGVRLSFISEGNILMVNVINSPLKILKKFLRYFGR